MKKQVKSKITGRGYAKLEITIMENTTQIAAIEANATVNYTRIQTDDECGTESFWDNVDALADSGDANAQLIAGFRMGKTIYVSSERGAQLKDFVENVEGWDDADAPTFAPNPLMFIEYTADELSDDDRENIVD